MTDLTDDESPPPTVPADLDIDVHLVSVGDLATLRRRVRTWSDTCGLSDQHTDDIVLAVDEIATNALEHARSPAHVRSWTTPEALFVQVDDRGGIRIPVAAGYHRPPTDGRRGRGLWMAHVLADDLTTHTGVAGTTVVLRFHRPAVR
jgi:anti-sigma regulatory factor (Ser/Thr protein kinase)